MNYVFFGGGCFMVGILGKFRGITISFGMDGEEY